MREVAVVNVDGVLCDLVGSAIPVINDAFRATKRMWRICC